MKKMKNILLAIISFMAFGAVTNAATTYSFDEVKLTGLKEGEYDLSIYNPDNPYNSTKDGFVFVGKTYTCRDGLEYNLYEVNTSGKITKMCANTVEQKSSSKDTYTLSVTDGVLYSETSSDNGSKTTKNKLDLENDKYTYSIVESLSLTNRYNNDITNLYIVKRTSIANTASYTYAIMNGKGTEIVSFKDSVDNEYDLYTGDLFQGTAAVLKSGSDFIVVSANEKVEKITKTNLYAGDFKDATYNSINVVAASSSKNYYVANITLNKESLYYLLDSSGFVKTKNNNIKGHTESINLVNIGGTVLRYTNGLYYNLDGTAYTNTDASTIKINGSILLSDDGTNLTFKNGSTDIYKAAKKDIGLNNTKFAFKYLGSVDNKFYLITDVNNVNVDTFSVQMYVLSSEETKEEEKSYKVVEIVDKAKGSMCAQALEQFYEDSEYTYYYNCIKSEYVVVKYENGEEETVKNALKEGRIKITDLDKYDISYTKEAKESEKEEKEEEKTQTPTTEQKYSCQIKDGKYYSKDGSVVDKKTYESVCGLSENPHTGIALPIILVITLAGLGLFVYKTKGKDLFKKI